MGLNLESKKMIQITCTFTDHGETKISYSEDFCNDMGIGRADFLQDILGILDIEYQATMDDGIGSEKRGERCENLKTAINHAKQGLENAK